MNGPPDFDRLYRRNPDPWEVDTSPYERRKLAVVLACLRRSAYARAWDPACGTGHLAAELAARADAVLATDLAESAVVLTRVRCRDLPGVRVERLALPEPPPREATPFDLVVLSEFFYYLDDRARAATLAVVQQSAAPEAEVVAVHWRHVPHDAWLAGAAAQQEIVSWLDEAGWTHALHHDDEEFVVDALHREPGGEPA